MTTRTSRTTRLRLVSLLAVLMLVVSACVVVSMDPSGLCECPNLEATAGSIDWIGDGTVPDEVRSGIQGDPARLKVTILYNTPDRIEVQVAVEDRLRDAGFTVTDPTPFSGRIETEEWSLSVRTSGSEEKPRVAVVIELVDDDARAAEILVPLVDALGTLP